MRGFIEELRHRNDFRVGVAYVVTGWPIGLPLLIVASLVTEHSPDEHLFESIQHAQQTATEWLWRYNAERSNMAPGGMTPYQKMANAA